MSDPRVRDIVRELRRLDSATLAEVARELRAIRGLDFVAGIREILPDQDTITLRDEAQVNAIVTALDDIERRRLRGTGRTTRMLQRALAVARHGDPVTVVASSEVLARHMRSMLIGLPGWKEIPAEEHPAIYGRMRFLSEARYERCRAWRRDEHVFFDHTCNRPEFEGPAPTLNGLNPLERAAADATLRGEPFCPCGDPSCALGNLEHWTCIACQHSFRASRATYREQLSRCFNCYRDYVNSIPGHGAG